jgi:hypothetical protein
MLEAQARQIHAAVAARLPALAIVPARLLSSVVVLDVGTFILIRCYQSPPDGEPSGYITTPHQWGLA